MHIRLFGRGPLAETIAVLAERAGHTVRWAEQMAQSPDTGEALDLVILAGARDSIEAALASISAESSQDCVVVDAMTPTHDDRPSLPSERGRSDITWIAMMFPSAPIVRAFASVPAEALNDLLVRTPSDQSMRLAVPLAGDDPEAKARVGAFMRDIGVEPFDLGALDTGDVLDPGGPLWGRALTPVEMLEAVGWLSGDG